MRVLVSFKPKERYDNFEGSRLRKSIKGALEINNIPYTSNEVDYFDVAHFISLDDESKINGVLENNIPVVISALYCESDPSASFLEYKNVGGNRKLTLSSKACRVLNKVSLVLTPTESAKQFLIDSGITTPIKVVSPGINLSRFNYVREDEKEIFYRYFRTKKDKKIVIVLGSYSNTDGVNSVINAAKDNPKGEFYYLAQSNHKISFKLKLLMKKAPSNLHFASIVPDDVYRSALINASIFVYSGYDALGYVSILEPMAAHTEVVIRKQDLFKETLVDGETCHVGSYSETLVAIIKDLLEDKLYPTTDKAFEFVASQGLDQTGIALKEIYESLISNKEE